MRILSLGAGVQSTTVLLLSLRGEFPPLDHAIFADTKWEPVAVYQHLMKLRAECEKHGLPVHVVTASATPERGDIRRFAEKAPVFVKHETGKQGMSKRTCTDRWKIRPVEKKVRELLGLKYRERVKPGTMVQRVFGISLDEIHRMRVPKGRLAKWQTYEYPLIDAKRDRRWCQDWLAANGWPNVPRSACVTCPFHDIWEWRSLRDNDPDSWEEAVALDKKMREEGVPGLRLPAYLHPTLTPLDEVNLDTLEDHGQMSLWGDECEGMCGV